LNTRPVAEGISYLLGTSVLLTPFAAGFEVLDVLPWKETALRHWVAAHDIGTLEIKKRGIDVDPAALRRRLRPRGRRAATLLITPAAGGAVCLVVRRVP
jgi:hypothetical protein